MRKLFFLLIVTFVNCKTKLCNCKIANIDLRNQNEIESKNLAPWIVGLRMRSKIFCMGFIVNEREILTSADCVYDKNMTELNVITNLNNINQTNIYKSTINKIIHPLFNKNNSKLNNIAILRLKYSIKFEKFKIEPACIEFSYNNGYFKDELITINFKNNYSNQIKYFKIKKQLPIETRLIYGASKNDDIICKDEYGNGAIYLSKSSKKAYVVAINNYIDSKENNKINCSSSIYFTRLSGYRDFIKNNINNYC